MNREENETGKKQQRTDENRVPYPEMSGQAKNEEHRKKYEVQGEDERRMPARTVRRKVGAQTHRPGKSAECRSEQNVDEIDHTQRLHAASVSPNF